MKEPLFTKS